MLDKLLAPLRGVLGRSRGTEPSWQEQVRAWQGISRGPGPAWMVQVANRVERVNVLVAFDSAHLILTDRAGDQLAIDLATASEDEIAELLAQVPRDRMSKEARGRFDL